MDQTAMQTNLSCELYGYITKIGFWVKALHLWHGIGLHLPHLPNQLHINWRLQETDGGGGAITQTTCLCEMPR